MRAKSLQSCLPLCDPTDCSPPGSYAHGILQAILDWVVMPLPRDIPDLGIKSMSLNLLHCQVGSLLLVPPGLTCMTSTTHEFPKDR